LDEALRDLAHALEARERNTHKLDRITAHINAGLLLDDILELVYQDFQDVIPYNRIGFALIEDDGQTVRARWAKSDQPVLKLTKGYAAPMAGSSLETIIKTGQPRILNDLLDYLKAKPDSKSTVLIVAEGMRSSLTCPLVANGVPVGFIFFSSIEPHVYADVHLDIFSRIADQLAVIVEKGQLVSELTAKKAAIEQQNEELRRLDELKNNFLGIAAHDLRSPIINIQLMADYLQDPTAGLTEAEKETFLNTISQQTSHLLALLNDLLDVSQIEAGQLKLNMESIDLKRFLGEAVE
jgi:K+-sensing histidine kinase KdpD